MSKIIIELAPCPICGGTSGYHLIEGSTYRWWTIACAECDVGIDECESDSRMTIGGKLPDRWADADDVWNSNGAHANTLRLEVAKQSARIAELEAQLARFEYVATKLPSDPYDEREGLFFHHTELAKLKSLPKETKLFALKDEK